ncbi:hypothetical protein BC829DRAFT_388044 [Chytridium lagenaria]|nr:hypothetical protein BC829DRAFT_388044 [Chytridium lagenaria]
MERERRHVPLVNRRMQGVRMGNREGYVLSVMRRVKEVYPYVITKREGEPEDLPYASTVARNTHAVSALMKVPQRPRACATTVVKEQNAKTALMKANPPPRPSANTESKDGTARFAKPLAWKLPKVM